MDSPTPTASRAPAGGLKLILLIVGSFAIVMLYGQWERLHRSSAIHATIHPAPNVSPSPNEP